MNVENIIWGLLGLIGVLIGIRYTVKYRKRTQIVFFKNTSISLFRTMVKDFKDIEIKFQGKQISENLIFLKGTFFNSGNVDIDKDIIHKPLEIELPEDYHWMKYRIIDVSKDLEIKAKQERNRLVFNWDLLKKGEYFVFDGLVECKLNKTEKLEQSNIGRSLVKDMKINHRIKDLEKINKEYHFPKSQPLLFVISFSILFLAVISVLFYVTFKDLIYPTYDVYNNIEIDSSKYLVQLKPTNYNSIDLIDVEGEVIKTIQSKDLIIPNGNDVMIIKSKISYLGPILGGIFCLVYLVALISLLKIFFKDRRLNAKLKAIAVEHSDIDTEFPSFRRGLFPFD